MKQSKKKNNKENLAIFGIIGIAGLVYGVIRYPYIVIPAILIIGGLVLFVWYKKRKVAIKDTITVPARPQTKEERFTSEYKQHLRIRAENEFLREQLKLNGKGRDLKDFKDDELIKELVQRGKIDHGI
jgi:hypothetical protein